LVCFDKSAKLEEFKKKALNNLDEDGGAYLIYVSNTRANLQLTEDHWPDIEFSAIQDCSC